MDYVGLDYPTMQPGMINLPSIERTVLLLYYDYYYCGLVQWFLFQTILFGCTRIHVIVTPIVIIITCLIVSRIETSLIKKYRFTKVKQNVRGWQN